MQVVAAPVQFPTELVPSHRALLAASHATVGSELAAHAQVVGFVVEEHFNETRNEAMASSPVWGTHGESTHLHPSFAAQAVSVVESQTFGE